MKRLYLVLLLLSATLFSRTQNNVGIGTTNPAASAALDVQSTDKGVLVPRIALTSITVAAPVSNPVDALLIYNTATSGSGNTAVAPGFYYWSTAANKWTPLTNSNTANSTSNIGYGVWGDCQTSANIGDYQPVADENPTSGNFGKSVSMSGSFAAISSPSDGVGGSVSIYQFDGTSWMRKQKITALDAAAGDAFGQSISLSGNALVVGAPNDDIGANANQGSAYIFLFTGSTWVQHQKMIASDGGANDEFGNAVAIAGSHVVVGVPLDDDNFGTSDVGSVYFYFNNGISCPGGACWQFKNKLSGIGGSGFKFGSAVAISGNLAAVGEPKRASDLGAAHIASFNGSNWSLSSTLLITNDGAGLLLGSSLLLSGNLLFVGAPGAENVNGGVGVVYVCDVSASNITVSSKIKPPSASINLFGKVISGSGDYLLIGANPFSTKAIYIYQKINTTWRMLQQVSDPAGEADLNFGSAIGFSNKRFVVGTLPFAPKAQITFFGKIN